MLLRAFPVTFADRVLLAAMVDQWVTVDAVESPTDAELLLLLLERSGVPVMLADEHMGMAWYAFGGVKVQVPYSRLAEAKSIVRDWRRNHERRAKHPGDTDADYCLACGSVMPEETESCPECGWSYRTPRGPSPGGATEDP